MQKEVCAKTTRCEYIEHTKVFCDGSMHPYILCPYYKVKDNKTLSQMILNILTQQCGLDCEKVNENDTPDFCEQCQTERICIIVSNLLKEVSND
jgi:hypothetical protein